MTVSLTPKAAALVERAMQLARSGEYQEAARAFERALQQAPQVAELHGMHADVLMRMDKLEAALAAAQRALRLRSGWGEALMLRGNIEARLQRFDAAEASFRQAMSALGAAPQLHANLGNVQLEQGKFADALASFEAALRALDDTALHAGRAKALYGLSRLDESERAWQTVLAREPDSLEALEQLLQIYMGARRLDELEQVGARGAALAPADATFRLGAAFAAWQRGRHEEAIALYREASRVAGAADPALHYEANMNEAMCLLKLGRWREGWERYRWRRDRETLRATYPQLAAEPAELSSSARPLRIRIHEEQGLGDELFFLRFAPFLRQAGHRLSYRCHPKLVGLLSQRADRLFEAVGRKDEPDPLPCDMELQSSDLALASGHEFAPPLPLAADPARLEAAKQRLRSFGPPPYIGMTWAAGLTAEERKSWERTTAIWSKRVAPETLGQLLRPLAATIVILQRKPEAADTAAFQKGLGRAALDASDTNDDLQEALALLAALDEYVGMSNTNMHLLAGLGGRCARVLTQSPAEWRWAMSGRSSPWFPGFELYRQSPDRTWNRALTDLRADLERRFGTAS